MFVLLHIIINHLEVIWDEKKNLRRQQKSCHHGSIEYKVAAGRTLLETVTESESGTLLVSFGVASIRLSGAGSLAPARD